MFVNQRIYRTNRGLVFFVFPPGAIRNEIFHPLVQVLQFIPGHCVTPCARFVNNAISDITVLGHYRVRVFKRLTNLGAMSAAFVLVVRAISGHFAVKCARGLCFDNVAVFAGLVVPIIGFHIALGLWPRLPGAGLI